MKKKLRILLLEDNKYHSLLVKRELINQFPYGVLSVFQSAEFARDELQRNRYDIAIIDYNPAWKEGLAFIEQLHREIPSLKIIMLVVDTDNLLSQDALKAGVNKFLIKDNTFHLLLPDIINKMVNPPTRKIEFKVAGYNSLYKDRTNIIDLTVGTLAHEINNPLMTILGEIELLLHNGYRLAPDVDRKLRIIEESAQRIKSAVVRLSSISEPAVKETPTGAFIDLKES